MCLPMTPAGPDSDVMKPIFSGSAARAGPTSSPAMRARRIAPLSVRTVASCTSSRCVQNRQIGGGILARRPARSVIAHPAERPGSAGTRSVGGVGGHIGAPHVNTLALAGLVHDHVEADARGPGHLPLGVDRGDR